MRRISGKRLTLKQPDQLYSKLAIAVVLKRSAFFIYLYYRGITDVDISIIVTMLRGKDWLLPLPNPFAGVRLCSE